MKKSIKVVALSCLSVLAFSAYALCTSTTYLRYTDNSGTVHHVTSTSTANTCDGAKAMADAGMYEYILKRWCAQQ